MITSEVILPVLSDCSLKMSAGPTTPGAYPTAQLQKGLLLYHDKQDLAEEGVGFGVPVLKRGLETIFPGGIEMTLCHRITGVELIAIFEMNRIEKLSRTNSGVVENRMLYGAKNSLSALIRTIPIMRAPLTGVSNLFRRKLGLVTTYEETVVWATVRMVYTIDARSGVVNVVVETSNLADERVTEVIVMNEQGAHYFDQYTDSEGILLQGDEIGCWDEVFAEKASFMSSTHHLAFSLENVKGAKLYRGRELIDSRLAWAGFGYSFPPTTERFMYDLSLGQIK